MIITEVLWDGVESINTYRSKSAKVSDEGWWMVARTVFPSFAIFCKAVITLSAMNESNPDVGSSTKSKFGFVMIWNHE